MTLSIMKLNIMTLSITTISIALSIMTLSIRTLSIMTLSIMTPCTMIQKHNGIQHYDLKYNDSLHGQPKWSTFFTLGEAPDLTPDNRIG